MRVDAAARRRPARGPRRPARRPCCRSRAPSPACGGRRCRPSWRLARRPHRTPAAGRATPSRSTISPDPYRPRPRVLAAPTGDALERVRRADRRGGRRRGDARGRRHPRPAARPPSASSPPSRSGGTWTPEAGRSARREPSVQSLRSEAVRLTETTWPEVAEPRAVRAGRLVRAARAAPAARHRHDHRRGARRRAWPPAGPVVVVAPDDRRHGQRRARRVPGHAVDRHRRDRRPSSSSSSARPTGPTASCSSTGTAATATPSIGPSRRSTRGGRRVLSWWPRPPGGDAHAGRTETSLLLALRPDLVRRERAGRRRDGAARRAGRRACAPSGVRAVSPNGVLGDPTGADAGDGRGDLRRRSSTTSSAPTTRGSRPRR